MVVGDKLQYTRLYWVEPLTFLQPNSSTELGIIGRHAHIHSPILTVRLPIPSNMALALQSTVFP
jgi:hypothetical protein